MMGINPDFTDASLTEMYRQPTNDNLCPVRRRFFYENNAQKQKLR